MTEENLICPYCGAVQENDEPAAISMIMYLTRCQSCARKFWYSVYVRRSYDSDKYEEDEQ